VVLLRQESAIPRAMGAATIDRRARETIRPSAAFGLFAARPVYPAHRRGRRALARLAQGCRFQSRLRAHRVVHGIARHRKCRLKTYVAWWVFAASRDWGQEPIGQRIVEVPDDLDQFEAYDSHAKFTAYAPADSIAKGEAT
jgi:hypothetical protein